MALSDDLGACIAAGGIALFGADTVYGLACDPADAGAIARMYALKGRAPDKPSALMWFDRDAALTATGPPPRTRAALERLLPGPVTVLLPDGSGLRVPDLPAFAGFGGPVLQTSANHAGGPDPRRLEDVPPGIRDGADLVIDRGELPGIASTVIDLREFETAGRWSVVREGALATDEVARLLG